MPDELERIAEHACGALGALEAPDSGDVITWEIEGRRRLDRRDAPLEVRGGLRLERARGSPRRIVAVHGGAPRSAIRLADPARQPRGSDGGWTRAVRAMRAALDPAGRGWRHRGERWTRRVLAAGVPGAPGRLAAVVTARVQVVRRGDATPEVRVDRAVKLRAALEHPIWPVRAGVVAAGPPTARALDEAVEATRAALAARIERGRAIAGTLAQASNGSGDPWHGPLVLFEDVAGAFVHEMAHAALETCPVAARRAAGAFRIVDDPATAPWPCGDCAADGRAGRPVVLWGDAACDAADATWRRADLAEVARPAPSSTRLESVGTAPRAERLPSGVAFAAAPGPTRYDPASRRMLLAVRVFARPASRGWTVVPGGGVIEIEPEQAWRSLKMMIGPANVDSDQALCTRLGSMHAVMVGAPTILLDPVRVRSGNALRVAR
ncbi:MAG: hypothetical protein Kow0062_09980 [Acidobacteriota bacterium]